MYNYLIQNPLLAIIFIAIVVIAAVLLLIKVIQSIGLEKVRKIVYDGFVEAEHAFKHGDNSQKFDYVVQLARSSIPQPFNMFITEALLRKVIQLWFDICKNLLDNGKID